MCMYYSICDRLPSFLQSCAREIASLHSVLLGREIVTSFYGVMDIYVGLKVRHTLEPYVRL